MWQLLVFIGLMMVPIIWAVVVWRRQQRCQREIYEHDCPLCQTSFEDDLPVYLGSMSAEEYASLDRFQRRFAGGKVRCGSCGGIVLCSRDGYPMRGYFPVKVP